MSKLPRMGAFDKDGTAAAWAIMQLPKHVLAELYADLFRQTYGESESSPNMIACDAARRAATLGHDRYCREVQNTLVKQGGTLEAAVGWWDYDEPEGVYGQDAY